MSLRFDIPEAAPGANPVRADVACFIGFVARRAASIPAGASEAALRQPVTVDSWQAFAEHFDWAARPVLAADHGPRCASWLGAAVRSFFAAGGRRAVIVRTGDPWPLLPAEPVTDALRAERLAALLGERAPFDPLTPTSWRGLGHLYGLDEPAMVCLPDLPELHAAAPAVAATAAPLATVPEQFVECSTDEPTGPVEPLLRRVAAPALDVDGLRAWANVVGDVVGFLQRYRRDCLFVGALPLCRRAGPGDDGADHAATLDPASWLAASEQPRPLGMPPLDARSAFVQLGFPWLRTRASADLPQGIEPPDGALAGLLAANTLAQGCYRTAAGRRWLDAVEGEPEPAWGRGPDGPWERLAAQVCVFAPGPGGWALQSDVTTARDAAWRAGSSSRLIASVLRNARSIGLEEVFDVNAPASWDAVRWAMEALLTRYWHAGGLRGSSPEEAFGVRCGPATMSRNDLDNGRLRVEVELVPAAALERITVVMALDDGQGARTLAKEMV